MFGYIVFTELLSSQPLTPQASFGLETFSFLFLFFVISFASRMSFLIFFLWSGTGVKIVNYFTWWLYEKKSALNKSKPHKNSPDISATLTGLVGWGLIQSRRSFTWIGVIFEAVLKGNCEDYLNGLRTLPDSWPPQKRALLFDVNLLILHFKFQFSKPIKSSIFFSFLQFNLFCKKNISFPKCPKVT